MLTRTRTRTIVFTDMADYTRSVSNRDREGLRQLLEEHQRFVHPVLTNRGGRIVKGIGDSFMASFESATDAVRACMDLVEAHGTGQSSGVTFRASLATGDVEEIENDAFGETVNLSSRINSRTPASEVWFSAGTWHCINQAEIPWESTGRYTLKGIPGEVEVFRAVTRHQAFVPDALALAIRAGKFVVWNAGDPVPVIPPGSHVILTGFKPHGQQLAMAVDSLPIADPSHVWLSSYNISPADRHEWVRSGRGLLIGTPEATRVAIARHASPVSRSSGSDTIILDGAMPAALHLVLAGLALPAVPYSEVVAGYSYDLLSDGRWVNRSDRALVRLDVGPAGVAVHVLVPGVQVDGVNTPVDALVPLKDGATINCAAGSYRFVRLDKEGYLGALVGDSPMRLGVATGQSVELGREPSHPGLLLPDRNTQDNIRWCAGPRAARAREKGFTIDKSLTGRRQTGVRADLNAITILPLHESCPTLLMEAGGSLLRLTAPQAARHGDMLLLGTTVVALREATG